VVGLAEAGDDEGALAQFRMAQRGFVAGAIEHDVLVDLVAEQHDVGAAQQVDQRPDVFGAEHRAGRVVRAVDHQHAGLRRDRRAHRVPVGREGERVQRDVHCLRPGEVDRRFVAVVAGVEDDHLVAGANDGVDGIEDRLGGAAGDRDLAVDIGSPAVAAFGLAGDRLAQGRDAGHRRVLVVAGLHRPAQRIDQASGTGKSGKPWPRLTAPCSAASCDITVKMVVPTFGSLVSGCIAMWGWRGSPSLRNRAGRTRDRSHADGACR
jgi:hypothetical protein